jgi:hypothetical protein
MQNRGKGRKKRRNRKGMEEENRGLENTGIL